jgi:3-oxoacyl-[acyl-carrier-protein] synthase II
LKLEQMVGVDDIVITGLGAVTPIGIGRQALEQALLRGECRFKEILRAHSGEWGFVGATVDEFDGKLYVAPRKALKMMSREVQIAYASAHLAWEDAGLIDAKPDPNRIGVVFGSEMIPGDHCEVLDAIRSCTTNGVMDHSLWGNNFSKSIFPLWMLRNLPNMPACHVAIAVDARGPNNTIVMEEISGILALGEAIGIMQRDQADMMIVGAVGSRVTPTRLMYRKPAAYFNRAEIDAPTQFHSRAFDSASAGIVPAESGVTLVLERRRNAVARNATIYGQVLSVVSRCGRPQSSVGGSSQSIASAAQAALESAGIEASDLAAVSAQGFSHKQLDKVEAEAIFRFAANSPVTSFASYLGTAGSASGLAQLVAGILATRHRQVLPILGCNNPDPSSSINLCQEKRTTDLTHLLQVSFTFEGQAVAAVVDC